jgi:hypothetical protein
MIALAANKTAEAVKDAILGALFPLAAQVETLTYDNGLPAESRQFAQKVSKAFNIKHPYRSCF